MECYVVDQLIEQVICYFVEWVVGYFGQSVNEEYLFLLVVLLIGECFQGVILLVMIGGGGFVICKQVIKEMWFDDYCKFGLFKQVEMVGEGVFLDIDCQLCEYFDVGCIEEFIRLVVVNCYLIFLLGGMSLGKMMFFNVIFKEVFEDECIIIIEDMCEVKLI